MHLQCHFDNWDNHLKPQEKNGTYPKGYVRAGTPAITQAGGTLILATNEFTNKGDKTPKHVSVGNAASKTIIIGNVISNTLNVTNAGKGKLIITDNADDSP